MGKQSKAPPGCALFTQFIAPKAHRFELLMAGTHTSWGRDLEKQLGPSVFGPADLGWNPSLVTSLEK